MKGCWRKRLSFEQHARRRCCPPGRLQRKNPADRAAETPVPLGSSRRARGCRPTPGTAGSASPNAQHLTSDRSTDSFRLLRRAVIPNILGESPTFPKAESKHPRGRRREMCFQPFQRRTLPASQHCILAGMGSHLRSSWPRGTFCPRHRVPSEQSGTDKPNHVHAQLPGTQPSSLHSPLPFPDPPALPITGRRERYWPEKRGDVSGRLENLTEISQPLRNSQRTTIQK